MNQFNSKGPFQSLDDRLDHLKITDTWFNGFQNGTVAVFETLKVCV